MSVVVSCTSPLHYLILCSAENILPKLFRQVVIPPTVFRDVQRLAGMRSSLDASEVIPPTVFRELQQPNTPPPVRQWAAALPEWVAVQSPKSVNLVLDVDAGELEAICLAQEIHADAVLMDDRAGRNAAIHCGLAVVGTIGLLEQSAARGIIELASALARLRRTNARLDPELVRAALARDQARQQKK